MTNIIIFGGEMDLSKNKFDIAIIGGGIVGTATAMELSIMTDKKIVIVESEDRLAKHQTGHNSGVIHSGLYYKPGSLKAKLCKNGREMLYKFCSKEDIPFDKCGKIVVATKKEQLPYLKSLKDRGEKNGLKDIRVINPEEIKELEPNVNGVQGLYVDETGIVDYSLVTKKFADVFKLNGGEIRLNSNVYNIIGRSKNEIALETKGGEIICSELINCAGLYSDRIARMSGVEPGLKIIPFRGEYFELKPKFSGMVKNLIYPVPDPKFPFLGVHFTRMIDGGVEAGPNAVASFKREGYSKLSFSLKDFLETTFYGGFWKMSFKYWKTGLGEYYRSFFKPAFVKALRELIPEIKSYHLNAGGSGVRAQALEPNGHLVDDFRIKESDNMIHVLNSPSPAATASISIGKQIAELAIKNFNYKNKK